MLKHRTGDKNVNVNVSLNNYNCKKVIIRCSLIEV